MIMQLRLAQNSAFNTPGKGCLIAVFAYFIIPAPFKANKVCSSAGEITCPCGPTGKTISIPCDPQRPARSGPCEKFKFCETCLVGSETCATCPSGRFGPFCSKDNGNAQENSINKIEHIIRRAKRDVSCLDLESPKLGSITCFTSANEIECIGRCIPGHYFPNSDVEEIVLKCERGNWSPLSAFPACASEGLCDLEMTNAGGYNCTTGSEGTYCDIRCTSDQWISSRFFCYPGRAWEPPLPHCIQQKNKEPPRANCNCQNGGMCDVRTEMCKCPARFEGQFCERLKPRNLCHDPGFIPNGDRWTTEGRISSRGDGFEVEKSVVYSCRDGFSLHGLSIITCQSSRQWSNSLPECKRFRQSQPTTSTTIKPTAPEADDSDDSIAYCQDPGTNENALRTEHPWLDSKKQVVDQKSGEFPQGFRLKYKCKEGFVLQGDSTLLCLFTGLWSSQTPSCQSGSQPSDYDDLVFCKDPGDIQDGHRFVTTKRAQQFVDADSADAVYPEGAKMEYECIDDFELIGQKVIICMKTGDWNSPLPFCL